MTFQVQIYWKDQKMERLKKIQSLFHSKVFKQGTLAPLTTDHEVPIFY